MKKTLVFPRLHKLIHPPKINFGIFKPVIRISEKKKIKTINFKKSPAEIEERPKFEKKNHILKENYSYIEEKNSFGNKESNKYKIKPKNLYDRLVLEKLKPYKMRKDSDSSSSSLNSEEKKLNIATINKIKIFSDNEETTFYTNNKASLLGRNVEKILQTDINDRKGKESKNNYLKNRSDVRFMKYKGEKERAEGFLEELVKKKQYFFNKNFINNNIFKNINEGIYLKELIEEMNKKKEEIPLYLYEDDSYLQNIIEKTPFNYIIENYDKEQYFYNRNQEILPEVVDYHNYLRYFANMYNSLGGKLSLDELYDEEIYIKNKKIKDEEEKIRENKMIKKMIKNRKLKEKMIETYQKALQNKIGLKKNSMELPNDYSYLDCPEFYENPKRKGLFIEKKQALNSNINKKKHKNKRTKSLYNRYFKNKFKTYN